MTAKSLVALLASVARTVAVKVPLAVGVPEISPVAVFRDKPVGKVPEFKEYERVARPPVTANKVE